MYLKKSKKYASVYITNTNYTKYTYSRYSIWDM